MRLHAGGVIAGGIADLYPTAQPVHVVPITAAEVARLAGIDLSTEEIQRMLESLDFECVRDGDVIKATAPWHRLDMEIPADLVEDIARLYGYDRIPLTMMGDELPTHPRNHRLECEEQDP